MATNELVLRPAPELLKTLREMAAAAALPIPIYATQILEGSAADFRLLRIPPSRPIVPADAPADEVELDLLANEEELRGPSLRKRLSRSEEDSVVYLYVEKKIGVPVIAKIRGCSEPSIYRCLKRHGITTRQSPKRGGARPGAGRPARKQQAAIQTGDINGSD